MVKLYLKAFTAEATPSTFRISQERNPVCLSNRVSNTANYLNRNVLAPPLFFGSKIGMQLC